MITRRGLLAAPFVLSAANERFPRTPDTARYDPIFDYLLGTTKNGGLAILHRGSLVYERYFGRGHAEGAPNLASVGKSFTSIAMGIVLSRRKDLFPEGLHTKVYTEKHLPEAALPITEEARREIKLGQLLAMSAGIPGNNPGYVDGKPVTLTPEGPDGWEAMEDLMASGKKDGKRNALQLWCKPGGGYSYATASIHLVSMIARKAAGMELEEFVRRELAGPLGWGRWGWGYRNRPLTHTPGGGGIAVRAIDMLSFGYLLLKQGRWKSRQIVPAEYVRACGSPSEFNPHYPYSLQFDVNGDGHLADVPKDAFWKLGSGGHCLYIVPSLDLVAWKMGGRDEQYDEANTGLPPAPATGSREGWREAVPADRAAVETLRMLVRHAS